MQHKGSAILNHVYSQREIKLIKKVLDDFFSDAKAVIAQRQLFAEMPKLVPIVMNKNLKHILQVINPKARLVKAIYFNKPMQANWYVTWHQDIPINVKKKIETEGYSGWTYKEDINSVMPPLEVSKNVFTVRIHLDDTDVDNGALNVIHGSHNKVLSDDEKHLITTNSTSSDCEVYAGGIHLMKPLILHASGKTKKQKQRRVIHLEFSSVQLDGGLEWLEEMQVEL